MAKDEKDVYYQLLSFGLWWTFVVYKTRLLLAKMFTLELFWRIIYSNIKGRIACWKKYCSWRLCMLGSKTLGLNVLELHYVMFTKHYQNV